MILAQWVIVLLAYLEQETLCVQSHKPALEPLSAEIVEYINRLPNGTWKAATPTRFGSIRDIRQQLGTIPDPNRYKLMTKYTPYDIVAEELPKEFDARKQWPNCESISEIRDQSNCGSCWAFGAVETMSDRICIASKGKKKPKLSAENLVSCCSWCGMGCNGGFPHQAWKYWVKNGIVTGDLYNDNSTCQPYEFPPCEHHTAGPLPPCSGESKTPKCVKQCHAGYPISYEKDKWYGSKSYQLHSDEKLIRAELLKYGPLQVDFEVYADFVNYKSGVYKHVVGALLGGHSVRLLGWGEENNVPYWLLANSWNEDWGEKGFFKIIRGKNECGIESDAIGGIPKLN